MKQIKYLVLGIAVAMGASSCQKDEQFLLEDPKTIYTVDNAFEKSTQVNATLVDCYYKMANLYGWHNMFLGGSTSGNLLGGYGSDTMGADGQLAHMLGSMLDYKTLNPNTGDFYALWNDLYAVAAQANLAIYGSELVSWTSEAEKAEAVAKARFFRGWAYLRLAECYGGVPIVPEYSEELKFDYQRSTREDVYKFAVEDFKYAASGLPEYPEVDGDVSKGIANHFLAEAYIALGTENGDKANFAEAIKVAQDVVSKHPMMTKRFGVRSNPADNDPAKGSGIDPVTRGPVANYKADGNVFYDLFQKGNYDYSAGNTEGLLVAQVPEFADFSTSGGLKYFLGVTCYAAFKDNTWSDAYKGMNPDSKGPWAGSIYDGGSSCAYLGGGTWGMVSATDYSDVVVWEGDFANDMRNAEVNRTNLVVTDPKSPLMGQVVTPDMVSLPAAVSRTCAKVSGTDGWGWDSHHLEMGFVPYAVMYGRDHYLCRSSETQLLLAEAYLRNGDAGKATEALNEVRKRAEASYMYDTITLRDILDERARELAWEEHRWATLLRWDASTGKNPDMMYQLEKYNMLSNEGGKPVGAPTWNLFPIPTPVINLNSEAQIAQNPGW